MALAFRNLNATPDDPVEHWGVEGILTAIERGGLVHLRRIVKAIQDDPQGDVAEELLEAVQLTDHPLAHRLEVILQEARGGEDAQVQRRIRDAIGISGLSLREFADRAGTSASRLSTYASGKVRPSAATFLRLEHLGRTCAERGKR